MVYMDGGYSLPPSPVSRLPPGFLQESQTVDGAIRLAVDGPWDGLLHGHPSALRESASLPRRPSAPAIT